MLTMYNTLRDYLNFLLYFEFQSFEFQSFEFRGFTGSGLSSLDWTSAGVTLGQDLKVLVRALAGQCWG